MMALFNSVHGGNIWEAATILGISPDQSLDISANINLLGMPVSVKRGLSTWMWDSSLVST